VDIVGLASYVVACGTLSDISPPTMKLAWMQWLWLLLAIGSVHADEFAFFDAVSAGDTSAVSESLAAGVDPNYADEDGLTPLILAAKHGRLEVMHSLAIS